MQKEHMPSAKEHRLQTIRVTRLPNGTPPTSNSTSMTYLAYFEQLSSWELCYRILQIQHPKPTDTYLTRGDFRDAAHDTLDSFDPYLQLHRTTDRRVPAGIGGTSTVCCLPRQEGVPFDGHQLHTPPALTMMAF